MLIAFVISLCFTYFLGLLLFLAARRIKEQDALVAASSDAKQSLDNLLGLIDQAITRGGHIEVLHNGNRIPFGVLLDKMPAGH